MQRGGMLPVGGPGPSSSPSISQGPLGVPLTPMTPHSIPQLNMPNFQIMDLDKRITELGNVSQRDDLKLRTLQEIWSMIDTCYNFPSLQPTLESLMHTFIKLFSDTVPQFIAENNTQQLRKLMLEIILRMSSIDAVRNFSKDIQKIMMRLVTIENEENAILAIKIIIDQGRSVRLPYCHDVTNALNTFKQLTRSMREFSHLMFTTPETPNNPPVNLSEEDMIAHHLQTCFNQQAVSLGSNPNVKFNLIPRATYSVRVLQEAPMLVVFFYQHHKLSVQADALEFMTAGFEFLNVSIDQSAISSPNFNQALADDFCTAQSKMLSHINIMCKVQLFMELILKNGNLLVTGVLQLLEQCPADLITVRKDVLMTLKYFFSCELRNKFYPALPRLISESALLGKGFTSIDHLRTFMYQMLADLLHHMRNNLTFTMLAHISYMFCRELHDVNVSYQVQIMSARLLNSVTECMQRMEQQNEPTRDLLFEILEALVAKLKVLAIYHLPLLFQQYANEIDYEYKPPDRPEEENMVFDAAETCEPSPTKRKRTFSVDSAKEVELPTTSYAFTTQLPPPEKEGQHTSPEEILNTMWAVSPPPIVLSDGRNLVKFVLQTCKFATGQLKNSRQTSLSYHPARERDLYERLLKYGVQCMDIFILPHISSRSSQQMPASRTKDEKETLESLASVFTAVDHGIFRELFTRYMDFLIERIFKNFPLQLMVNTFLVRNEVPFFAEIMLRFLMSRMSCLAVTNEKTGLYVKLFKIIFSAIGTHQPNIEGERMLKPYLPDLIRQSTVLALSAREPLNYFLLLRALFRSIGGGAHDILYGKFLPLLPNLLQFLNKLQSALQSCQHRTQMRELFVELCLTVPVRLSSLLPYLPLLMDPLVCALNGSPTLVQQGLRTLELCVDNLQPDYLFEHMLPIRGALMQGLWRVVGTSTDASSAAVAFRILGKFGGANRKMLNEPQQLQLSNEGDAQTSCVSVEFARIPGIGEEQQPPHRVDFPLSQILKAAVEQMKLCAAQAEPMNQQAMGVQVFGQQVPPQHIPNFYLRKQCMELAKSVLLTGLGPMVLVSEEWINGLNAHLQNMFKNADLSDVPLTVYKCGRENDRALFTNALLVLFYGVVGKDLRQSYLKFFNSILRQLSLQGILEFAGGNRWLRQAEEEGISDLCMDSAVLVDALAIAFSDSNKDFCFSAMVALRHINDTCTSALRDLSMMSRIPFCRYLVERIMQLCYGPAWFARLGGASALSYMVDNYPSQFIEHYMENIVGSLIEVILGTVDEISSGAVDMAMEGLEKLHRLVLPKDDDDRRLRVLVSFYSKYFFHGSADVREKMRVLLKQCAEETKLCNNLADLIEMFKIYFYQDIERTLNTASCMSLADATASFEAFYFLFDVSHQPIYDVTADKPRWNRFVGHLLDICQNDPETLLTREHFKKCESCPAHFLPPIPIVEQIDVLRANALYALVTCYRLMRIHEPMEIDEEPEIKKKRLAVEMAIDVKPILLGHVIGEGVTRPDNRLVVVALRALLDLQSDVMRNAAKEALAKCAPLPLDVLLAVGADLLTRLGNKESCDIDDIIRFACLFDLNKKILDANISANIVEQLTAWFEKPTEDKDRKESEIYAMESAIRMLAQSEDVQSPTQAIRVAVFAANFEYKFSLDARTTWVHNIATLLSYYSKQTLEFFFKTESLDAHDRKSLFRKVIKSTEAKPLRQLLKDDMSYFEKALQGKSMNENGEWIEEEELTEIMVMEREMLALILIDTISRRDPEWLVSKTSPIPRLQDIWNNAEFKKRYVVRSPTEDEIRRVVVKAMTEHKYKVPKLFVNCFIRCLRIIHKKGESDFELLFDIITVFIGNYITDFCYVRRFLETEIIPVMPLPWRRQAFLQIMEKFEKHPEKTVMDLRVVKAIQYLLMPLFVWAFERYNCDPIIGDPPSGPEDDDPNNLVSRLANVIEAHRTKMSDGMVIVIFQLCTMFTHYAAHQIHNNMCKKQGGRLRVFMLFAWPCLTLANHQDPTMRYTGFHFLAHIIEQFTINRRIVLQVFSVLCSTYQADNRDQIRRAIDVLTPAVPLRMEDGHQQILSNVKRVLLEESYNLQHVQHIFTMICRNYRVYFNVRHELITPLLNSVNRSLFAPNSVIDGISVRKQAVDVCEMIIKWDLIRNQKVDPQAQVTAEEALEIDKILEKLKLSERDRNGDPDISEPVNRNPVVDKDDLMMKPVEKEHVDLIINMLVRFALQIYYQPTPNSQVTIQQSTLELCKRSQGLLRAALKPCVWGEIATIRSTMLEKLLTISAESIALRQEGQSTQLNNASVGAQQALELLHNLLTVMPRNLLLQTLRPLQRALISCLNSNVGVLVRSVNSLVGKLFERTRCSEHGLDELEIFNQYIGKYLNDQFSAAIKSPAAQVSSIFSAFSLLRCICIHQPAYIETVCLTPFIKITEKAAREHISYLTSADGSRDKMLMFKSISELLSLALELIRPRIEYFSGDSKRYIAQNILLFLIDRTNSEKILDSVMRVIGAMVPDKDRDVDLFSVNTAVPLLGRVQRALSDRYRSNKELMGNFLGLVLRIYENKAVRDSELVERLTKGFYWGLTVSDAELRDKFLHVWEEMIPKKWSNDLVGRLRYILRDQKWALFNDHFWIRHALWLLLRCINNTNAPQGLFPPNRKRIQMTHCATPFRTFELAARLREMPAGHLSEEEPMDTGTEAENEEANIRQKLNTLLEEQRPLLEEARTFDFCETAECIASIAFGVQDTSFIADLWVVLFQSIWAALSDLERSEINQMILPFLSSGAHNSFTPGIEKSVLSVWMRAVSGTVPMIQLPPNIIKFIASRHECWHLGMQLLEQRAVYIPRQLHNPMLIDTPIDIESQMQIDVLDYLSELYSEMGEFDQFAAVWQRRAMTEETIKLVSLMQMGEIEEAASLCENQANELCQRLEPKLSATGDLQSDRHIGPVLDKEYDLALEIYQKCLGELMKWTTLRDLCNGREFQDVRGLMQACMHFPDWNALKDCRDQVRGCIPPDFVCSYTVYNAMLSIMHEEPIPPMGNVPSIAALAQAHRERMKRAVEETTQEHILRWRSLPCIVSNAHTKILQAMNIIREVEESIDLRFALIDTVNKFETAVLTEMKGVIKVWRNRTPTVSDDMSFVATIYDWRCQMHEMVLKKFNEWESIGVGLPAGTSNQSILPIHSAAQGQLLIAKYARTFGFYDQAISSLDRMATMPTVPMLDAHQKVIEHAKSLRELAKDEKYQPVREQALQEGVRILKEMKVVDMNKDQVSKLMYQRGCLESDLGLEDAANNLFSHASQSAEVVANPQPSAVYWNVMKSWGHALNKCFFSQPITEETVAKFGRKAVTCYLTTSRHDFECKARKYIARVIWLTKNIVACGPNCEEELRQVFIKHVRLINAYNWLYWMPQLMSDIKIRPTSVFLPILLKLAAAYPLQTFYGLREVIPLHVVDQIMAEDSDESQNHLNDDEAFAYDSPPIRLLRIVLRHRPTDVRVFHRILSELDSMAELWTERHLRFAIALKEQIFSDLHSQMGPGLPNAKMGVNAWSLIEKWKIELKKDLVKQHEHVQKAEYGSTEAEPHSCVVSRGYLRGRVRAPAGPHSQQPTYDTEDAALMFEDQLPRAADDKICLESEIQFVSDATSKMLLFLESPGIDTQLIKLANELIKWINTLTARLANLPKRIPLEASSTFLNSFSHRIGCVEMPSDLLCVLKVSRNYASANNNQASQYVSMMSRFEPRVEVGVRGGQVLRRIHIRAQTGKTCSFYLRKTVWSEKMNQVPQFFLHLNGLLQKERETARRHLIVPCNTQLRASSFATITEIAAVQPYMQANESGVVCPAANIEILHPIEILGKAFVDMGMCPDALVVLFFERYAAEVLRLDPSLDPSHLQSLPVNIFQGFIVDEFVSPRILQRYLASRFTDATMYYMMRKQVAHSLAVLSMIELTCRLTPTNLHDITITANTGVLFNSAYNFDILKNDSKKFEHRYAVPFRLTPNMEHFLGMTVEGDLMWSLAAVGRCLRRREPEIMLRPLFWDEHAVSQEAFDEMRVCQATSDSVEAIREGIEVMNSRARRDYVSGLLVRARMHDNLSRMPPAYHPWF